MVKPKQTSKPLPRDLYYSSQWQVIQENVTNTIVTTVSGTASTTVQTQTADQYVWGIAYVNELVLRDSDSIGNASSGSLGFAASGLNERLYALQDANYDVVALANTSGTVVERFSYDPYGNVTVLNASGTPTTDAYSWLYMYQGGRIDPVTGLYEFQNRDYSPTIGRWMEQDPLSYVSGANMYEYVNNNPVSYVDPYGLLAWYRGWGPLAWGGLGGYGWSGFWQIWDSAGEGAMDGDKALVNGLTPFVNPFSAEDFYNSDDPTLDVGFASGVYIQNVLTLGVSAGEGGIGATRELLGATMSASDWNVIKDMTEDEKVDYILDTAGGWLKGLLPLGNWSQYLITFWRGGTPLAWLALLNYTKEVYYYGFDLHNWRVQWKPPGDQ